MWMNVVGIWGIYLGVLLLSGFIDSGFGLIAVYTTLINATIHMLMTLVRRESNPGLYTAVVLFGPLGTWAFVVVDTASGLDVWGHLVGITAAILLHLAIGGFVMVRRSSDLT